MLTSLSKNQNDCVSTITGPVMVLAGPGTGKTFTVIQRLKYMLSEKNISPESILCLTFSETAAKEMQERLQKEVGEAALGVTIGTYHSFCNEIITNHPAYFEMAEGVDLVDDITKYLIMREIFEEINPEFLRTEKGDIYYYIKPTISSISEIKKTRTSKEKYFEILEISEKFGEGLKEATKEKEEKEDQKKKVTQKILKSIETFEKNIAKAKDVWQIFEIYSKKLKEKNYIDFDDMINFVLDTFQENPEFLQKIASKYQYFLVDEYQDTNFAQNQLVFRLSEGSKSNNIFVVGDDDQIIYGFQGAQSDNLEKFLHRYPEAKVICLKNNFRSTQNILDISYELISQDSSRIEFNNEFSKFEISKKLIAQNETLNNLNSKINLFKFSEDIQEKNFIVAEIEKIVNSDNCPQKNGIKDLSEIAILVKKNDTAKEFMDLLKGKGLPSQLKKTKNIFEVEASIFTIFYLKILLNAEFHSDKLFAIPLCHPFDFNPYDYSFLLEQNRSNSLDFISIIRQNPSHNWKNPAKIKTFLTIYDELKEEISKFDLKNLIKKVIQKTGLLDFYNASETDNADNLNALERLITEAQNFQKNHKSGFLGDFLTHLDISYQNDLDIEISKDEITKNAIQLMTLHGSKGREFEYVFIPELCAKKWEKYNNPEQLKIPANKTSFEKDSEQLRLLFVGMTRAKHKLYLSFPSIVNERPHELTQHIEAISHQNPLLHVQNFTPEDGFLEQMGQTSKILKFDYKTHLGEELKQKIKNIILSPSSISVYEKCPRKFLYNYIYKIPSKEFDTKELDYGNAIHKTLEYSAKFAIQNKIYPTIDEAVYFFEQTIEKMEIQNTLVKETSLKRGKNALKEFYPHFLNISPDKLYSAEFSLGSTTLENINITGKIDKIEMNNDGSYFLSDYKTGKSPGFGKIAYEKHIDQIRFYKLAFEIKNPDKKVSHVGIIYVEDFDKNYIQEVCEEDDILIKEKIFNTYENIQNLKFDAICEKQSKEICKRCNYKLLCRINVL